MNRWIQLLPVNGSNLESSFPLAKDQIKVDFSRNFNRQTSKITESLIAGAVFEIKKKFKGENLPKFRLHGILHHKEYITLQIGLTTYLEYLITNYNTQVNAELREYGLAFLQNADAYLSNAIGNLALLHTLDNKLVFIKRSKSVATFPGFIDAPGGHPEPNYIKGHNQRFDNFKNDVVKEELWSSISREIFEEIGISENYLSSIKLLGVICNINAGYKPEMIFYVPVSLDEKTIRILFQNAQDRHESEQIFFADSNEKQRSTALIDIPITTPAQAALNLLDVIQKMR